MRYPYEDRNPHNDIDEQTHSSERLPSHEVWEWQEPPLAAEHTPAEEIPSENRSRRRGGEESDTRRMSLLSRVLASTAVVCTAATAIILPLASTPAAVFDQEEIGYHRYECVVTTKEAALDAHLLNEEGETLVTYALSDKGDHRLAFENLYPEEQYRIRLLNRSGQERVSHTFETDAFLFLDEEQDGRIPLRLHEELHAALIDEGMSYDAVLHLLDSRGGDWGSSLLWDPFEGSVLYTDGLYRDTYSFVLEMYLPDRDDPLIYRKLFDAGAMASPVYDVMLKENSETGLMTELELLYREGDLLPYSHFEIILEHTVDIYNYMWVDEAQMRVLDSGIYISLADPLVAGEYRITIWGQYTTADGEERSNPIWQGFLTSES